MVLATKSVKSLFFKFFQIKKRIMGTLGCTNQLIKFDLDRFSVTVLCILNQEDH